MKLLKVTLGTKSKKVYLINIYWVKNQLNCPLNQILSIQSNANHMMQQSSLSLSSSLELESLLSWASSTAALYLKFREQNVKMGLFKSSVKV